MEGFFRWLENEPPRFTAASIGDTSGILDFTGGIVAGIGNAHLTAFHTAGPLWKLKYCVFRMLHSMSVRGDDCKGHNYWECPHNKGSGVDREQDRQTQKLCYKRNAASRQKLLHWKWVLLGFKMIKWGGFEKAWRFSFVSTRVFPEIAQEESQLRRFSEAITILIPSRNARTGWQPSQLNGKTDTVCEA